MAAAVMARIWHELPMCHEDAPICCQMQYGQLFLCQSGMRISKTGDTMFDLDLERSFDFQRKTVATPGHGQFGLTIKASIAE